eukprot:3418690-Pleurochrysis_carterae.AAC.1
MRKIERGGTKIFFALLATGACGAGAPASLDIAAGRALLLDAQRMAARCLLRVVAVHLEAVALSQLAQRLGHELVGDDDLVGRRALRAAGSDENAAHAGVLLRATLIAVDRAKRHRLMLSTLDAR